MNRSVEWKRKSRNKSKYICQFPPYKNSTNYQEKDHVYTWKENKDRIWAGQRKDNTNKWLSNTWKEAQPYSYLQKNEK